MKKKMLSVGLCTALALTALCGCGSRPTQTDLTARGIVKLSGPGQDGSRSGGTGQGSSQSGGVSGQENDRPADAASITDFALKLFQQSLTKAEDPKANTLISPMSVLYALSMTAGGAKGETLSQIENVLGASVPALNTYLYQYRSGLPEGDGCKLSLANSIWIRDDERLTVNGDFLAANEKWYGADIYKAPFDNSTVEAINQWVSDATDEMIPNILDEIPGDAVLYLINGLAFDAEWDTVYKKSDVWEVPFTEEDGTQYQTELMHSRENYYLEDDNARGFLKYYKDRKYAFAALLPNDGISVSDYVAALDGQALHAMLSNPVNTHVDTAIPKFETEYSAELSGIFKAMGMTDAFDGSMADLSGIGSSLAGNLYINRILHKTYIAVDEKRTKAGAATAVELGDGCAADIDVQSVILNRPFVYMIIDCEENLPLFIGTMMSVK